MRLPVSVFVGVLCLVVLPGAVQGADPKPKELILGKWEVSGANDVKATLDFQKDGTIVIALAGTELKAKYKFVKEDVFEVELPGSDKKQAVTIVKISKDEMVTKDSDGKEDKFKRTK